MTTRPSKILITTTKDSELNEEPSDFMEKLGKIMSDSHFKKFFKDYFNDWTDVKTAVMLMKTYAFLDEEYQERTGHHMDPKELVEVLRKMMKDSECRQLIVREMSEYTEEKHKFLEYYHKIDTNLLLKN